MKTASIIVLVSAAIGIGLFELLEHGFITDRQKRLAAEWVLYISIATWIVTSIGTASTILLGWWADKWRRE